MLRRNSKPRTVAEQKACKDGPVVNNFSSGEHDGVKSLNCRVCLTFPAVVTHSRPYGKLICSAPGRKSAAGWFRHFASDASEHNNEMKGKN